MTNTQQKARILSNLGLDGVKFTEPQRTWLQRQGVTFTTEIIATARKLKDTQETPEGEDDHDA